jgi:hypothetical protein
MNRDPGTPILGSDLYASARHRMIQRLINIAMDKVAFIKTAKEFELNGPMGIKLKPGDLADKGLANLEQMVNDKIGSTLDAPFEYAMKSFADQLELSRQQGLKENCHTMECYLGRLPWMQATLFFNIFFPFWDALMDLVSDALGSVLGGPLKAIQKAAAAAKAVADSGRDALAKANAVKQKLDDDRAALGQGISAQDVIMGNTDVGKGYDKAMDSKADEINGPDIPEGKFQFPIEGRPKDCEGKEITKSEWDEVKPENKWTEPPPAPADPAAAPDGAAADPAAAGDPPAAGPAPAIP